MDTDNKTSWGSRNVFITGGTGLIGSWVVKKLLAQGARVVLLVKDFEPASEIIRSRDFERCVVVYGRLEDYATIESALSTYDIDSVFHLGAQTLVGAAYRSPLATFEANVRGTYNLLEACRVYTGLVRRIVVASSDKAYGDKAVLPYTEEMSLDARHTYDVSKSCTDLISQSYAHTYGLPIAVTRFGNVYGGGDINLTRIVPSTILSFLRGERPVIRSDGLLTRDYLYVEDVAAGYLRLAQALDAARYYGQAFNFSSGLRLSVLEMVAAISKLMHAEHLEPDVRNTARAEIRHQHLSSQKADDWLGWRAQVSLQDGLARTIAWYRELYGVAGA